MNEEMSFAELLAESYEEPVKLQIGDKIKARVVRMGRDLVFVDLGGKSEGIFHLSEVIDAEGEVTIKEGDDIQVFFLSAEHGEIRCTTRLGKGPESRALLESAFKSGIPVAGMVEGGIKGGFAVKLAGAARAFCPFSQIGVIRAEDEDLSGRELDFKIIEFGEDGRNIIISHRKVLEEQRREKMIQLRETLSEGMTVVGTISSIRDFGAFVDIGGLDGLLPVSEICWGHVEDINERLRIGQKVEVKIMKLDWEAERFSFSLKDTMPDPWHDILGSYPLGSSHKGRVARLTNFGAFITLEEGVDGLLHISKLGAGRRLNHPREVLETGQEVEVKIEAVKAEERRISLALSGNLTPAVDGTKDGEVKSGGEDDYRQYTRPAKSSSMGTLGDLLTAKLKL